MKHWIAYIVCYFACFGAVYAQTTHFTFTSRTGGSANIIIPTAINPKINGIGFEIGDEIAAVTPSGLVVGAVAWTGNNIALTVWGDNDQTTVVDGAKDGETLSFRVWDKSANQEYGGGVGTVTVSPSITYKVDTFPELTTLTVTIPTATNQPPVVANAIANQSLTVGSVAFTRNLITAPVVFTDPNNDTLTFTASSSNTSIATASILGTTLTVTPVAAGTATITVTANDGKGGSSSTNFSVTITSNVTPISGLIVSLPFNGNANDESGSGNNGSLVGASFTSDRFGISNSAVNLTGFANNVPSFIQIPYKRNLLPEEGRGVSYKFWFKTIDGTKTHGLFSNGNADLSGGLFYIAYTPNANGKPVIHYTMHSYHGRGAGTYNTITLPYNLHDGISHQLLISVEGKVVKCFVDGIFIAQNNYTFNYKPFDETRPIYLGKFYNSYTGTLAAANSDSFNGVIEDFGIYSKTLTDGEVKNLYDAEKVQSVNQAPTAKAQTISTNEDTAKAIVLEGTDPEGQTLTYAVTTQPTKGTLSGTAPNLTYTPNKDVNGTDSFTFTVNDGTNISAPATVSITINPVNDAPTCTAVAVQNLVVGTTKTVTLACSDADGDTVSFGTPTSSATNVATAAVSGNVLTLTPVANGTTAITIPVSDGKGGTATVTVTVTVSNTLALSVTPIKHTIASAGVSVTSTISITNGTGTPTCASNATWLTVTTCSVTQVTATIAANTSSTARTGMISITVTGATGSPATVTVEQAAATATPTLSVTPAKQTVVAGGGTSTFAVSITNSTGTPTCASNATWLTVTTCSVTQVITQAAANTGSLRSGTVTVTLAGATGSPATVTVEQAAGLAPPSFTVTPAKQTIGASGGSLTFSINMPNGSGAPTCSWLGDWLSASCSTSQLLVYTTANTGPARIGTVTLSLAGETPVTVTIEQGAVGTNPGLVVTPAKQTVVAGGGTSTFAVSITNSTGTPTCASNATWLTVTTCSATQVITQAAANTGSLRSGTVTVTLAGATGSPATVTVEQANASTSGVVTVRLSSTLNGYVGQSTDTGILVGDTSGKNIVAYAGKLVFDPSILKVSLMPTDGTLSAGWSVTPNMNNSGELIFAAANATPLAGTGNLLKLKVEFLKAGITELKWASFTFNEGDPSATMSGATVTVSSFVCGDATMNGSVSGLDASRILQHAAGILALEGEGLKACDVTGNGSCSASDASLILQYVAQLNPVFNCRFNALGKTGESSSVQTNRAATIRLDVPTTAVQGQTGVIGIKTSALTSLDNVLAYTFSLGFNSNVCRIIELDPANTLSGGNWSITPNTNVANSIIVAAANATPMLGEGTLLKLKVKYLGTGTCNLVWSKFEMNEGTPSVVSVNNSFTVSPATGVEAENIPAGFGIQGVYPNPFNQTTTLLFSLAHAGQVKTEVYSLTGQKIWDTPMHAVLAGEGKIVLNAVGWSAGVYVARITVQTAGQTMVYNQKITVIK